MNEHDGIANRDTRLAYATGLSDPPRRPALAAAALVALVAAASVGTLAGLKWGPGTWWGQGVYLLCKGVLFLLPVAWLIGIDRGRASWSPARQGGVGAGVLLGVLIAGAIFGGYALMAARGWAEAGPLRALAEKNRLTQAGWYWGFAAATTFVNALLEEYVWRWFVVRRWEDVLGRTHPIAAAILAAACFTAHHVVVLALYFPWPAVALGSAGVFTGGVVWSGLYVRYRSVWPGYACHVLADAAIFVIGWRLIGG